MLARADQVRERELVERGGAGVGGELLRGQRGREPGRARGSSRAAAPARATSTPCRRTRRARGRAPGARASGAPVVAELGVVVVLHDEPPAGARPGEQRVAALRPHHRAGRELVARRDDDGVGARRGERVDAQPVRVERDGTGSSPARAAGVPVVGERRVLERDAARAALGQHREEQHDAPGCSRRRRRSRRARPRCRGRGRGSAASASRSAAAPSPSAVVERGVRRRRRGMGDRARPQAARERRDVGRRRA